MFGHDNVRTMSSTHARNNASAFKNLVLVWGPRICACTRAYIKRQTNINAHAFTKRFVYIIMYIYIYIFHSFPRVEISSRSTYGAQIPEKKFPDSKRASKAERSGGKVWKHKLCELQTQQQQQQHKKTPSVTHLAVDESAFHKDDSRVSGFFFFFFILTKS